MATRVHLREPASDAPVEREAELRISDVRDVRFVGSEVKKLLEVKGAWLKPQSSSLQPSLRQI